MSEEEKITDQLATDEVIEGELATEESGALIDGTAEKEDFAPDYEKILGEDMDELSEQFLGEGPIRITDLKNPLRYGALRDLGLSAREAYLASGGRKEKNDNRSHLFSSVPAKSSSHFCEIPRADLYAAREIFSDMSDAEIRNLYKKVTQ